MFGHARASNEEGPAPRDALARCQGSLDRALWRELIARLRRVAALFVALALAGCAQGTAGQAGPPYVPASPADSGTKPEHGGWDGGGGDGST